MDKNFPTTSDFPDSGQFVSFIPSFFTDKIFAVDLSENTENLYSLSHMSMLPSLAMTNVNNMASKSGYEDDFNFSPLSTITRW